MKIKFTKFLRRVALGESDLNICKIMAMALCVSILR